MPGLTNPSTANELTFAAYPPLREGYGLPRGWRSVQPGDHVDAVVLTSAVPEAVVNLVLKNVADPLVPVVSLVPESRPWIDTAGTDDGVAWERAQAIQARLRELPDEVRYSSDPEDVLLARMYSRDMALQPVYDPGSRELVCYPIAGRLDDVSEVALRLYNEGLVTRTFFDRVHCCPDCRSSVLSVREECHHCRSSNIDEETMIHHFKCGQMEPESRFRSGKGYVCPKCSKSLRHIGLDYDKPGSVTRCLDCGSLNDKPVVGFKCIACGNHHDVEQVPVRTWYSYKLTARGTQRVLGNLRNAPGNTAPNAFNVLLEHAQREEREFKTPYQLVRMTFENSTQIRSESIRMWEQTRLLVLDALHSALREVDVVREEENGVLMLLPRTDPNNAAITLDHIRKRLATILKADLKVQFEVIDRTYFRAGAGQAAA